MPVDIDWYNQDKQIGIMTLQWPWSWAEFIEQYQNWHEIMQLIGNNSYLLIDATAAQEVPNGAIRAMPHIAALQSPYQKLAIIIGLSSRESVTLYRFYGEIWNHVAHADSIEEGLRIIRSH